MRATIIFVALGAAALLWRAGAMQQAPVPASASGAASAGSDHASQAARRPAAMAIDASTVARANGSPAVPAQRPAQAGASALASIEAAVRDARRQGKGEQEVHRLRSASMPAAQVEALAQMEAAETSWRQRVEALQSACAANVGCDDARASFTHEELARTTAYAPPTLRR